MRWKKSPRGNQSIFLTGVLTAGRRNTKREYVAEDDEARMHRHLYAADRAASGGGSARAWLGTLAAANHVRAASALLVPERLGADAMRSLRTRRRGGFSIGATPIGRCVEDGQSGRDRVPTRMSFGSADR